MVSNRDRFIRCLIHIPAGIFTIFCGVVDGIFALVFFGSFMVYEVTEDWRLKDKAYIDIFGYLVGLAIGCIGLFVFQVIGGY